MKDELDRAICVGSGGQAGVFRATYLLDEEIVVKLYHSQSLLPEDAKRSLLREFGNMQVFNNKNVMKMLGLLIDDERFRYGIMMKYLPNGSLLDIIDKHVIAWSIKIRIVRDVSSGMAYLHEQEFVHTGIKCANILLDEDFNGKIADFGNARFIGNITVTVSTTNLKIGTLLYSPPEAFQSTPKKEMESDVWSYGIMTFEICAEKERDLEYSTKRLPYPPGMSILNVAAKLCIDKDSPINQEQIEQKIPADCPQILLQTMKECCKISKHERPDFKYLEQTLQQEFSERYQATCSDDILTLKANIQECEENRSQQNKSVSREIGLILTSEVAGLEQEDDEHDGVSQSLSEVQDHRITSKTCGMSILMWLIF